MKVSMQLEHSHQPLRAPSTGHNILDVLEGAVPAYRSLPRAYRYTPLAGTDMSEDPRRDFRGTRPETPRQGRFYQFPSSRPTQNFPTGPSSSQVHSSESPFQQPSWPESQRPSMMNLPPPQSTPSTSIYQRHHSLSLDSSSSRPTIPAFGESVMTPDSANQPSSMSPTYTTTTSAQKRAFRQRRKDPSCDACRERKVKCDATDTMSCSECASRQVKCQFTKETNRRMSSMKQLQDLERQLSQAKQQNDKLRSILRESGGAMDVDTASAGLGISQPDLQPSRRPERGMERLLGAQDQARRNVRVHSRGLFKAPPAHRIPRQVKEAAVDIPPLPPKQTADQLILSCHDSFCLYTPVLHWPTFLEEYETTFKTGSLERSPRSWIALLFAMFALGTLSNQDQTKSPPGSGHDGQNYLQISLQQLHNWADEPNIDHCRAALMVSTYYLETNLKSASWTWLAVAVSFAMEVGLNQSSGSWTPLEAETRRRVWWATYNWERSLSLELAKSPIIKDDDIKVPTPDASGGLPTHAESSLPAAFGQYSPSPLEVVLPIARLVESLRKLSKDRPVPAPILSELDGACDSIASAMPEPLTPYSTLYLDPNMLRISIAPANARIMLHRLNLGPGASGEERAAALSRCLAAAESTARLVNRTLQTAPTTPQAFTDPSRSKLSWEERARLSTCSMLCSHLWRCTLFLAISLEFGSALSCVRVSTAMGDLRQINIACGRYLIFFLEKLAERMRSGQGSRHALGKDEEMLAYASGDMLAEAESGWIWAEEGTPGREEMPFFSTAATTVVVPEAAEKAESSNEVWPRVESLLMSLSHEQQRQRPLPEFSPHARSGSAASLAGSEATGSGGTAMKARFSPGGSEQMNIANII